MRGINNMPLYPFGEKLGEGTHKEVYGVKNRDDIAIAKIKDRKEISSKLAKAEYYLMKILNYFIPEIPCYYAKSSKMIIMERKKRLNFYANRLEELSNEYLLEIQSNVENE